MTTAKVQSRGQITLPSEARREAGINPGDTVFVEVLARGELRLRVLPRLGPRELRERYPIDVPIDEAQDRPAWQAGAAEDAMGRSRDDRPD